MRKSKLSKDEPSVFLNPNCSEVIWRLKGRSKRYEGTNQGPFASFIEDILEIFVELQFDTAKVLVAEPIYLRGDGGPDTLEWSFKYAQDLVTRIRDPRELEYEEELDNQIVEEGYDDEVSRKWDPIVMTPRDQNAPLTDAERLLTQIHQNDVAKKRTRKKT